eukprot:1182771-Prorocentrum_minimum.AAC.2
MYSFATRASCRASQSSWAKYRAANLPSCDWFSRGIYIYCLPSCDWSQRGVHTASSLAIGSHADRGLPQPVDYDENGPVLLSLLSNRGRLAREIRREAAGVARGACAGAAFARISRSPPVLFAFFSHLRLVDAMQLLDGELVASGEVLRLEEGSVVLDLPGLVLLLRLEPETRRPEIYHRWSAPRSSG